MKFDLLIIYSTQSKNHENVIFMDEAENVLTTISGVRSWFNSSQGLVDIQGCIHNLRRLDMIEIKLSSDPPRRPPPTPEPSDGAPLRKSDKNEN